MTWEVEFIDEFASWWNDLDENEQDCVDHGVGLLESPSPSLPFPYSSDINGSNHGNMRELHERMVPQADRIYDEHLRELAQATEPRNPTKRR
jgi:hypothetical protein